MKYTIFALGLLFIGLVSCKSVQYASGEITIIPFEIIESNSLMGGGAEEIEESIVVCNSEAELDDIKQKMNSVNYTTEALDAMEIDFNKETVIGYFQPVRSSGGYALEADRITLVELEGQKTYNIHYVLTTPQGAATTVLTQPFIFVKTDKIETAIHYTVSEKEAL